MFLCGITKRYAWQFFFCTIKGRAARRWLVCLPLAQNLRTVLLHAQYCLLPHCYEVLPFTRHITSHG